MQTDTASLVSSLRALTRQLLASLDLLESSVSGPPQLLGIQGNGDFRLFADALPRPRVPDAEDDIEGGGGLGYDDILRYPERLIQFIVGPWDGFEDGDTVQILLGDRIYGSSNASVADKFNSVDVFVPAERLSSLPDGVYDFVARVVNRLGIPVDSMPRPVRIKLALPGGPDPVAATPYRNENLTAPRVEPTTITPDTPTASVAVEPYENMAVGDKVRMRWGVAGNELTHIVVDGEVGSPILFQVDRSMLTRGGFVEGLEVVYDITDLAYNWSLWSPPTLVVVEDPAALDAPWVSPTVDDAGEVIDIVLLEDGDVSVQIYTLKKGDRVTAHFLGTTTTGELSRYETETRDVTVTGRPVEFSLPHGLFPPLVLGRCEIWYTVERESKPLISLHKRLSVIRKHDPLEAPSIVESNGGGVVPPAAATIEVKANPLIVEGTRVTVELYGRTTGDAPVSHTQYRDIGSNTVFPLYFAVPGEKIAALAGSKFTISYTVETRDVMSGTALHQVGTPHAIVSSPPRTYEVLGASRTLPAPVVRQADGDWLDPDKVGDLVGLEVDVSYPGMATDDVVTLSFIGTRDVVPWSDTLRVHAGDTSVRFYVPKAKVSANDQGDVSLEYSVVYKNGGATARSNILLLHVGKGLGNLPAPIVPQESAGVLLPGAITAGVDIQVPNSVELKPTDRVMASFGSWRSEWAAGAVGRSFHVPVEALGAFLGTNVSVQYVVEREGASSPSAPLPLHLRAFADNDPLLPVPSIAEAGDRTLDLSYFAGDASAICTAWPLMAQGQRIWLRIYGFRNGGGGDTIVVYNGDVVTPEMLRNGIDVSVSRARLEALQDNSSITLELKVAFDPSGSEAQAIRFPVRSYTILTNVEGLTITLTPASVQVGDSFMASAAGGRPPYRFSANPTSVATIDGSGANGRAVGAGQCTITVTDNAGRTATHGLTVGLATGIEDFESAPLGAFSTLNRPLFTITTRNEPYFVGSIATSNRSPQITGKCFHYAQSNRGGGGVNETTFNLVKACAMVRFGFFANTNNLFAEYLLEGQAGWGGRIYPGANFPTWYTFTAPPGQKIAAFRFNMGNLSGSDPIPSIFEVDNIEVTY